MPNTSLEQVTNLAAQLSPAERLALIEHLARDLQRDAVHTKQGARPDKPDAPPSLYGAWKGKFPEDIDLDAELAEIRGEWLKELDEMEAEAVKQAEK